MIESLPEKDSKATTKRTKVIVRMVLSELVEPLNQQSRWAEEE